MKLLLMAALALNLALAPALAAAGPEQMPPPQARALWNYITKTSPYAKWGQWPGYQGLQPSRSPHGPYNRVYVNQAGLDSTKAPLNYGTIQVKVAQTKNGKVKDIVAMYKIKGYNPQAGDWFWAKYSASGQALAAGKLAGCIRCHGVLGDNDYVMVHQFR